MAAAAVKNYDVVVVGAGAAGLSAALSAARLGANVCVLEKSSIVGGCSLISSGAFNVVLPTNSGDSIERHYKDTLEAGEYRGEPELIKKMVEEAPSAYEWLQQVGVVFKREAYRSYGGIYPRAYNTQEPYGKGYIIPLYKRCLDAGVEIFVNAEALRVSYERYRGYSIAVKTVSGEAIVRSRSLVAASGGFAGNSALCTLYDPRTKGLQTMAPKTIDGSFLFTLIDAGADSVGMDFIQLALAASIGGKQITGLSPDGCYVLVNSEGKRFVDETGSHKHISDAIFSLNNNTIYSVINQQGLSLLKDDVRRLIYQQSRTGNLNSGSTPDELAVKIGVSVENLKSSIRDLDDMSALKAGVTQYFAVPVMQGYQSTAGGLRIDVNARVLDVDGNAMSGLFAAGEVTGGIHGANRVGGNGLLDAVVFGRTAGENAARA